MAKGKSYGRATRARERERQERQQGKREERQRRQQEKRERKKQGDDQGDQGQSAARPPCDLVPLLMGIVRQARRDAYKDPDARAWLEELQGTTTKRVRRVA